MAELDRAGISLRMGQSREAAGLTQPEIADLLHVHFRSVQDWESPRKHVVPFDRLGEWAELVNVSREWLLYGEAQAAVTLTPEMLARVESAIGVFERVAARLETVADRLAPPAQDEPRSG